MLHGDIFKKLQEIYPIKDTTIKRAIILPPKEEGVNVWFQNGPHSIRVRFVNNLELVFTYYSDTEWCLETMKYYIRDTTNA